MSILNPDHLFAQAEKLADAPAKGRPRQVDIRRAISTAYYGVFHAVATAAGDEFAGKSSRSTKRYALVYRAIDHRWLYDLCGDLKKPVLPKKYMAYIPAGGLQREIAAFATAVVELQEDRHSADYDPSLQFKASDAFAAVQIARAAIASFERASLESRQAFLSLLLFPMRR